MTENAVEVDGLVKRFGHHRALDGVDLRVPPGTVHAVLGPNGAGKTTLVRVLATLLRPDEGRARVLGHDVATDPTAVRARIALTGQYASVDDVLSATENLVVLARLLGLSRRDARQRAADLLDRFGLTDAARRPVAQFSGGMRRRLDIAASLVGRPPLIFLDEPTTGLDPRTRQQMWDTVRELVADGTTVLLTTQYLEEADQLADRVCVVDHGRVVADDTPHQLKRSVGGQTLQVVVRDPARLSVAVDVVAALAGARPVVPPEGGRLTVPVADERLLADVVERLRLHDVVVEEIGVRRPTLDEVFFALTSPTPAVPEEALS